MAKYYNIIISTKMAKYYNNNNNIYINININGELREVVTINHV